MDPERFAQLIARAGDKAFNFAFRLSGSEADARDLVQESFMRALEHFSDYDPSRPFDSWVLKILHNIYLDSVKRHGYSRTVSIDAPTSLEDTDWADLLPEKSPSAAEELIKEENLDLLAQALKKIPLVYRSAVTLCDIEGLSYEEISKVMNIPVGTVRSRIHQGRVLLKQAFEALEKSRGKLS